MALRELPSILGRLVVSDTRPLIQSTTRNGLQQASRKASSASASAAAESSEDFQDLESDSSFTSAQVSEEDLKSWDPVKRAQARKRQLPPSRYQYRPPRYYRGPLNPHQPPPASDPASRLFVPGPFQPSREKDTWHTTIAPDLMTLMYSHKVPGTVEVEKAPRLREWDDSSPYHKGRPKRGPRGGTALTVREQNINWQNIPKIEEIVVHSMVKGAMQDSAHLHVAGMVLQSVTGVRPQVHRAKHSVALFGIRETMPISLTCKLRGDEAWAFVDKCVNLVFPRIKDWPGVKGTSGDSSGNLAWGFDREGASLFPEVEVNYDMYPPRMIPGFHVLCKTTATSDRHARLLLSALGVPFYGKYVD